MNSLNLTTNLKSAALLAVTLLIALNNMEAHADSGGSFGRLFTTVEERLALDQWAAPRDPAPPSILDSRTGSSSEAPATAEPVAVETPPPERAQLSGVLLRHDGRHVVWVNGKSELSAGGLAPQIRAGLPRAGSLQVPVRAEGSVQWLKPGQVWLIGEDRVEEAYQVTALPPRADPESAPDEPL